MAPPRVDYDRLAPTYHSRYDRGGLERIDDTLQSLLGERGARRLLEVGCGTGRWLESLRRSGAQAYGADSSFGMLSQAAARLGSTGLVAAKANHLPFASQSLDLIYSINAIHHFDDPRAFLRHSADLLRPAGQLVTIGIDPRISRRRYFYEYFEGSFDLDLQRYPSFGQLVDWMSEAAFEDIELRVIDKALAVYTGADVFRDPFLKKDSNSLLALLTDEQYAAGLRAMEKAVADEPAKEFRSELIFAMVSGQRSTGAAIAST